MGWREQLGGPVEDVLTKLVQNALEEVSPNKIKAALHEKVDDLVDEYIGDKLEYISKKIVANIIDQIDGVDDIPDV